MGRSWGSCEPRSDSQAASCQLYALSTTTDAVAGGVSASLSGWLLHVGGSYELPMLAIFGFLLLGATSTLVLMQRKWAPKVNEIAPEVV